MSVLPAAPAIATTAVCLVDRLVPERGAAALVDGRQVALFRVDGPEGTQVHAIDHRDPFTGANVLARGIVGAVDGRRYVASPLHKQRFDLQTGACLDDDAHAVRVWRTHLVDGVVHVEH